MIKISDFAKQRGVTVQAIYKHFNKHKPELEGHYEKRGKNGTWLDNFAQDYISNLMIESPVILADGQVVNDLDRYRTENEKLKDQLIRYQEKMMSMLEENTRLQIETKEQSLRIETTQNQLDQYVPTWFGLYKKK